MSWALKDGFYEIGEEEGAGQAGRMREVRRRLGKQRILEPVPMTGQQQSVVAKVGWGQKSAASSLKRAWSLPTLLLLPDSCLCPSFPWIQMLHLCLDSDPPSPSLVPTSASRDVHGHNSRSPSMLPQSQSPRATQVCPPFTETSPTPAPSNFLPSLLGLMERHPGFLLRG